MSKRPTQKRIRELEAEVAALRDGVKTRDEVIARLVTQPAPLAFPMPCALPHVQPPPFQPFSPFPGAPGDWTVFGTSTTIHSDMSYVTN
jgi:hypothetical protein